MNPNESRPTWQPGEAVVLRYLTRDGRPGMSWPCTVVVDSSQLVALYIPRGVTYKAWANTPDRGRHLADAHWRRDVIRLMYPGRGYSIWAQWDDSDERRFRGYYINFEEPFRRSAIGFDTNDHTLDILVTPRGEWSWKDKDEFEARVEQGIYSREFAASVRDEAERVIAAIDPGLAPFADGWEAWAPHPEWPLPELPPAWSEAAPAVWDRAPWAYLSLR